jgi:hypothetical protein
MLGIAAVEEDEAHILYPKTDFETITKMNFVLCNLENRWDDFDDTLYRRYLLILPIGFALFLR